MNVGYGTIILGGVTFVGLLFTFLAIEGFPITISSLFAISKADNKAEIPIYSSYAAGSINYY